MGNIVQKSVGVVGCGCCKGVKKFRVYKESRMRSEGDGTHHHHECTAIFEVAAWVDAFLATIMSKSTFFLRQEVFSSIYVLPFAIIK